MANADLVKEMMPPHRQTDRQTDRETDIQSDQRQKVWNNWLLGAGGGGSPFTGERFVLMMADEGI